MRGRAVRCAALLAFAVIHLVGVPRAGGAQIVEESRLLREAASRESQGDLQGAEQVLRRILEANPTSSGGLFALERILRARGEAGAILPVVDAYLVAEPTSTGVRHLKLRVLVELDSLVGAQAEAEAWFRAQPTSETAYREVANLFQRAFGPDRALEVLKRGRTALGRPQALALEMGDVLISMGRRSEGLEEWAQAVGDDGGQATAISRRVAGLPDDPQGAARSVARILGNAPGTARQRAGVQIALELRLGDDALALARRALAGTEERARGAFLADVARRARDAGLTEVASWAYGELGQDAGTPAERRQFDLRLVEISLAAGDTVGALEAQRRVVDSYAAGSVDHRRASAQELRLQGAVLSPDQALEALEAFRARFPGAAELDGLAADVAGALLARGDHEGAEALLEGMEGPRSSLQRGYLLLGAERPQEARNAFLLALPGLEPADATGVIQFVTLLGRLSPPAGAALAKAGARAHQGRGREGVALLVEAMEGVEVQDRPALLAEAARMADRAGGVDEGAELRTRLLRDHPESTESAEASLALARYHAGRPDGAPEAIRLLEDLVVRSPGAPMVPDARRELERLRSGR